MITRIARVTNIYPESGRVKVQFEDEHSTSGALSMLTMNKEVSMPSVGDRVVTLHMENGSSKGFVLGTYYSGGGLQPQATSGYRKDFNGGAYAKCNGGAYKLKASSVGIAGGGAALSLNGNASLIGGVCQIGSAAAAEDESEEIVPLVYLKITEDKAELKSVSGIDILADGELKLSCSYGEETFEKILKRIERIEDQLGLPHDI